MVKIKICGVRNIIGAQACADNAVDYVGFNFVSGRRRAITPKQASELSQHCGKAKRVGVFYNQSLDEVFDVIAQVNLNFIQLHGSEPPEYCETLAQHLPLIKAFAVDADFEMAQLTAYQAHVQYWLFDAPTAGQGLSFDWDRINDLQGDHPFFLAGGLNPSNLGSAIRQNRVYAVDTASGIEVDGEQSTERIQAFCRAAREADEGNR